MAPQDNNNELSVVFRYLPSKYLAAYKKGSLSDDDLLEWGRTTGVLTQPKPVVKPTQTPTPEAPGFLDRVKSQVSSDYNELASVGGAMKDSASAAVNDMLGGGIVGAADTTSGTPLESTLGTILHGNNTARTMATAYDPTNAIKADEADNINAGFQQGNIAEAKRAHAKKALDAVPSGLKRSMATGMVDAAGAAPVMVPALAGGEAGIAGGAVGTYLPDYLHARQAGLSPSAANQQASIHAGIVGGISSIPGGSFLEKLGVLPAAERYALDGSAAAIGKKVASSVASSGAEQATITAATIGADKATSMLSDDAATKKFAEANTQDFWQQIQRSFVAGGFTAAAIHAPIEAFGVMADAGKLAAAQAERTAADKAGRKTGIMPTNTDVTPTAHPSVQGDLFGTPDNLPTHDQYTQGRNDSLEQSAIDTINHRKSVDAAYAQANPQGPSIDDLYARHERAQQLDALGKGLDNPQMADALRRAGLENVAGVTAKPEAPAAGGEAPRPLGEQQDLPLNSPLQPADSEILKQQLAAKRARDEAAGLVTTDRSSIESTAMSKRQADRRAFAKVLVESTRDLPDHEAATQHVADNLTKWDNENPLSKYLADASAKRTKNKGVKAPALPTAVDEAGQVPPGPAARDPLTPPTLVDSTPASEGDTTTPIGRSFDDLKASVGLKQQGDTSTPPVDTGVRTEDVSKLLTDNKHSGDAKVLSKLIVDRNLKIVDDASEIPGGAVEQGTGGYYDGKHTYVVANQLNRGNMMGDLLNIAAHEVKHGADHGAGEQTKASLSNLIGEGANKRIGAKIENQAKADTPANGVEFDKLGSDLTKEQEDSLTGAQWAVHAARKGSTPETYGLELPAYFINAARDERSVKGNSKQIADNVVSAVRNAAKRRFGDKADVNLKDVAHLSDKLLKEVALEGKSLHGDFNKPLAMIIGKSAKDFKEFKDRGHTYDSVDGNEKAVVTDQGANLSRFAAGTIRALARQPNKEVALGDILNHNKLYDNYPEVHDNIHLKVDPAVDKDSGGYFRMGVDGKPSVIGIAAHSAELYASHPGELINLLLHEVQHYIQKKEGHALGSNPTMFLHPEDHTLALKHAGELDKLDNLAHMANTYAPRMTENPISLARIKEAKTHLDSKAITQIEYLRDVGRILHNDHRTTPFGARVAGDIEKTTSSAVNLGEEVTKRFNAADNKYMETHGELEARFTEDNRKKSQAELPINPEDPSVQAANRGLDIPANESTIIKDVDNGIVKSLSKDPAGLPMNSDVLRRGMVRFEEPANKLLRVLKGQLSYTGNIGKELTEMREDSTQEAGMYSHRAMNALGRLNASFDSIAKSTLARGKTHDQKVEELKAVVNKKLDEIAKIDGADRRQAALAAFVRDNPKMRPLMDAVNEITQLSKTLLIQLIKTHPDPTPDQLRTMNTIHDNSFRYATRMYAAFQGDPGRAHSLKMIRDFNEGERQLSKTGEISPKLAANHQAYQGMRDYLIAHDLTIPDAESMDALPTDRLSQLFDTWVGKSDEMRQRVKDAALKEGYSSNEADQVVRDQMIEALDTRAKSVGRPELEGKARDLIKGMLGLNKGDAPFAQYYRNIAQDRSILEHRERLPPEIRKGFGEIVDPSVRLAVTIAKQGELVARTRMLLDMKEKGIGKWVIEGHDAGLPGNEKFTVTLNGENYGPLNGMRTTEDIAAGITSNLEMFSSLSDALAGSQVNSTAALHALTRSGIEGLKWVAGRQKLLSVVASVYNIGQNFAGSAIGLVANGVVDPRHYLAGLKVGGEVIADTLFDGKGQPSAKLEEAIRYGLLDSARVQEIRATPQRVIRQMISDEPRAVREGKSLARRGVRAGIETFAMSDAWIKVSAFDQRVDVLSKLYKAEGVNKSPEDIKREAADMIKNTTISYSRVPPVIKVAESIGATTFMPYFYSVPRVIGHNYIQGAKDFVTAINSKSPEARNLMFLESVKRIAGATASTFGTVMAMRAIAAYVNGPDNDKYKHMQELMPDDARFSDSIYVGTDSKKIPLFARISRTDPFGPVNDLIRVYYDPTVKDADKMRYAVNMAKGLVFTNRITQAALKVGYDYITPEEMKHKDTKLQRIFPSATEKAKDAIRALPGADASDAESFIELLDGMVPGMVNMWDPKNAVPAHFKDESPDVKALAALTQFTGGKLDRADPELSAAVGGASVKKARDDGRKLMADGFTAHSSTDDMLSRYKESSTNEYVAMRKMSDIYQGMTQGLGYTPRQAQQVLQKSGKLSSLDVGTLRNGRINSEVDAWISDYSSILSKKSLQQREANGPQHRMSDEEIKQNKQDQKDFLQAMKTIGLKIKE